MQRFLLRTALVKRVVRVRKAGAECLEFRATLRFERSDEAVAAGPVWKSNFGRPTSSTRRRPRNCICSMARRFYAIDATMYVPVTAAARWRGGSRGHEGPRNNSQDILTHWLIFAQHRT